MSNQPKRATISIRALLIMLSISIPSIGFAQTNKACPPAGGRPPIQAALDAAAKEHGTGSEAATFADDLTLSRVEVTRLEDRKKTADFWLTFPPAISTAIGAIVGGGLRLSPNKSTQTAGIWVGIGFSGAGATVTGVRAFYDLLTSDSHTQKEIPLSVQCYVLAQKPDFKFHTFRRDPSELQNDLDRARQELDLMLKLK